MKKLIFFIGGSLLFLVLLIPMVDYYMAKSNKKPIFTYNTLDVISFDVEVRNVNKEYTIAKDPYEPVFYSTPTFTIYYGLGYRIYVCDKCKNKVTFLPFGMKTTDFDGY